MILRFFYSISSFLVQKSMIGMTLIRIGLDLKNLSSPSFEALGRLKGIYGIECISFGKGLELLLFINDKIFQKLIQNNSKARLEIYLQCFGLNKDDYEKVEILDDFYLINKFKKDDTVLKGYFVFSSLSILDYKEFKGYERGKNNKMIANTNKNVIFDLVEYLQNINCNFILQIFSLFRKNNLTISGQLIIFHQEGEYILVLESIKENIDKILRKFGIKFKTISNLKLYKKLSLNLFLRHHPYNKEKQSSLIVNEILKIPNLNALNNFEIEQYDSLETLNPSNFDKCIPLGFEVIPGLKKPPLIKISFEDLTSHFCCFGMTSQGKSRLMYNILNYLEKTEKKFLVMDPKGEYFEALANTVDLIKYYKVGSLEFPLTINIFSIPEGLSIESHIQFIYSLLLNIMGDEVTPQMNRLLFKAIEQTVQSNGSMHDFISLLEHPERLKLTGSYLELSGSAVLNRILLLITGPAKNCFLVKQSSIEFSDLIKKNVVIDLSNFELVENKISRKIFVNTFLHNFIHTIKYRNSAIRELGLITNFILIEEIQKIAPLTFQGKNEINSFIGLAPWTVRAYGICMGFIGSDPNVETPIITNTGLSLIFYTKSNVENLLKLMGIPYSDYYSYLRDLQQRKRFLVCFKGNIKLTQSFDFKMPLGTEIKNKYEKLINLQ